MINNDDNMRLDGCFIGVMVDLSVSIKDRSLLALLSKFECTNHILVYGTQ